MSLIHREPGQGPNRLLNTREAAAYLGLGVSTLNRWRCEGSPLEYVVLGTSAVRYRQYDLDAFIEAGVRRSTSEALDDA